MLRQKQQRASSVKALQAIKENGKHNKLKVFSYYVTQSFLWHIKHGLQSLYREDHQTLRIVLLMVSNASPVQLQWTHLLLKEMH